VTFKNIQDRVMARTNLTSTDARSRLKNHINERLRRVATSTNVGRVRFGSVSINTVANVNTITSTGLVKIVTASIPAENQILDERTTDQLRNYDTDVSQNGVPRFFAVKAVNATTLTVQLYPEPDAIYAVVLEGILTGTDLSADADVPGLPEDFHDILIFGALADELPHLQRTDEAAYYEDKFEKRLSDLKYFLAKSAYLRRPEMGNVFSHWWLAGVWP
jgi:hypothetical protein